MLVASMVLAHKADDQLRLLLSELGSSQRSRVFLHLDQKALQPPNWLLEMVAEKRVRLVERRVVRWGGFSMIEATRALLEEALADPNTGAFVLLSGSSFPVHGVEDLVDRAPMVAATMPIALWSNVYDESTGIRLPDEGAVFKLNNLDRLPINPGEGKVKRLAWTLLNALNCALPYSRQPPISIYKGSQWFCIDRNLADHFLEFKKHDLFFRGTVAPDELLFQSLYVAYLRRLGLPLPLLIDQCAKAQGSHYIPYTVNPVRSLLDRLFNKVDLRAMSFDDIEPALKSGCVLARKCDVQISQAFLKRKSQYT